MTTAKKSAWVWGDAKPAASSPLARTAEADVCVVGAGIAGLSVAYFLAKEGKKVIVLDDGKIGSGETGNTTAHLSCILGSKYSWLEKVHGKEFASLIVQSHMKAIEQIEKIVGDENIACEFFRVPGYLFLAEDDTSDTLQEELDALRNCGLENVSLVPSITPAGINLGRALHVPNQAQFHPMQYLHGLARAFEKHGGIVHTDTHVHDLKKDKRWTVMTDHNHSVHCTEVVLATNAPIHDNVQIYGKQAPYRTFALGAQIPKGSLDRALLWDTHDPYHYVRTTSNDDKTDLLIVGGEDHKTGQENDAGLRFERLERWAKARFPMMGDIPYHWSGQVMETYDGIAMIGRLPGNDDGPWIVTGDSGNGMTHGTIAGMLLSDVILGRSNPWTELYDPSRLRVKAGRDLFKENMNVAKEMATEWMKDRPEKMRSEETGMIVEHDKKKIALYRDAKGTVHACSAVCPHKGCIVQWNSFEKSWDCPCHGSRFSIDGTALNGPTIEGLKPLSANDIPKEILQS